MKNSKTIISASLCLCLCFASCGKVEQIIEEEAPVIEEETTDPVVVEEEVWTLKVEAGEKGDAVTKASRRER